MASAKLVTIKRRADFLKVRGGARWATPAFVLETQPRGEPLAGGDPPRFGFTVTKKLGGAVVRNRTRRRLKSAISIAALPLARQGQDYVVVARGAAETMPFSELASLVADAMARIDRLAKPRGGKTATATSGPPGRT